MPTELISPVLQGIVCAYCPNVSTELVDSAEVYGGVSYGLIWKCPECGAYVGVHKGTDKALGRVANAQLRIAKQLAHTAFDRLWRLKAFRTLSKTAPADKDAVWRQCRNDAYAWLSTKMGTLPSETHIGMFDEQQCAMVVEICLPYLPKSQPRPAEQVTT